MTTERLLNTRWSIAERAQRYNNERQEQWRREEELRRNEINAMTQRGLIGALQVVGQQQERQGRERMDLARLRGVATGESQRIQGDPATSVASEVGAAVGNRQRTNTALAAQRKRDLEILRQEEMDERERLKAQLEENQAIAEFEREAPLREEDRARWLAEQRVRERRADAYERGASRSTTSINVPVGEGVDVMLDKKNRQDTIRDIRAAAETVQGIDQTLNLIRKNPQALTITGGIRATAGEWAERLGIDVGLVEDIKAREGINADLALNRLQALKPLLGVLTGKDYEISLDIFGGLDFLSGSRSEIVAKLEAVRDRFKRMGRRDYERAQTNRVLTDDDMRSLGLLPDARPLPEAQVGGFEDEREKRFNEMLDAGTDAEEAYRQVYGGGGG